MRVLISAVLDDLSAPDAVVRLRAAAANASLSDAARERADKLARRLENGVTITLLGPAGIGKSAICDGILRHGRADVPNDVTRVFTAYLAAGDPLKLIGPQRELPLPGCPLGHARLIDLALPADPDTFADQVREALKITDVVLWCSQAFGADEAALWEQAPDELKDHSFLLLTKADLLAQEGKLTERITALQDVAAEEFHSLFPTATSQLTAHLQRGGTVSDAQVAASGLKALIDAVSGLVTAGQHADLDSAVLFLERQGLTMNGTQPVPDGKTSDDMTQAGALPPPFASARDKIMERAFDLAELGFDEADGDMSGVLELCGTISEDIIQEVNAKASEHPEIAPWCEAFEEASDKIMLMSMENDTRSAADAVTILLQLRRDLETAVHH